MPHLYLCVIRLAVFFAISIILFSCIGTSAEENSSFQAVLRDAIKMNGPFYTWTLPEKAAFYDHYIYHGSGTRRGVPDERHISPAIIRKNAPILLAGVLSCSVEELSQYTIDLDFWIEAFMDCEEAEHEYYSVCFLQIDSQSGIPHNTYQLTVSPYSGDLLEAIDMESGSVLRNPPSPTLCD